MSDKAAALVETAIVMPILILLVIGGLILGLATVEDMRLERATGDAALLTEDEARQLVASVGGRIVCWSDAGGCFDDGLTVDRIQIVTEGRTWTYPTGSITPTAQASRPTTTQAPEE